MRIRPFKLSDSEHLVKWQGDERSFAQWCKGRFSYPLTVEQVHHYYREIEGNGNAWTMTALDDSGTPVGHVLMRNADYENESIHIGFIIIDPRSRGKGYGREMVSLVVRYSFDILKVKRVTLNVFDNNPSAHKCYKAVGFKDIKHNEAVYTFNSEKWGTFFMAIERSQGGQNMA